MRQRAMRATAVLVGSSWIFAACSTGGSDQAEVSTGTPDAVQSQSVSQVGDIVPAAVLGQAAQATCENVTTGRVSAELAVADVSLFTVASGSGTLKLTSDFDMPAGRVSTTVDASGMSSIVAPFAGMIDSELGGDIVGSLKDPATTVVDGDNVYVKAWPFVTEMAGADTPWIQISVPDGVPSMNEGIGPLGGVDNCDFMGALAAVGGEMTDAGTEQIDGVETTHYTGKVDLTASLDKIPDEAKGEVEDAVGWIDGAPEIPLEVWVGDDGLLRRLVVDMDLAKLGMDVTGSAKLTVNLTSLGEPVPITVPPADQVTVIDIESLLSKGIGFPGIPAHD